MNCQKITGWHTNRSKSLSCHTIKVILKVSFSEKNVPKFLWTRKIDNMRWQTSRWIGVNYVSFVAGSYFDWYCNLLPPRPHPTFLTAIPLFSYESKYSFRAYQFRAYFFKKLYIQIVLFLFHFQKILIGNFNMNEKKLLKSYLSPVIRIQNGVKDPDP